MRVRDTLLGLVVVGLVAGGMLWTRARSHQPELPGHHAGTAAATTKGAAEDAVPDVTTSDAAVDAGPVTVTLSITPRPPAAFSPLRARVRVQSGGVPATLEGGTISFEMTMPMGDHRYTLIPGDAGWDEADVVLPMCSSGNRRWYASVGGTVDGRPISAWFRLDLADRSTP